MKSQLLFSEIKRKSFLLKTLPSMLRVMSDSIGSATGLIIKSDHFFFVFIFIKR